MSSNMPIFVLCCARSGSTLLRYMLDTHPDVAAPPELHLLATSRQLLWLFENTATTNRDDVVDVAEFATARTRRTLESIMQEYTERAGKKRWAEKSVSSIDCVDTLTRLFPDAQVVCLYRQALDVMASCAQAGQRQRGLYGFEPFVARSTHNVVDGLAEYWIEKNQRILDAERQLANPCVRLKYEDLVSTPDVTFHALLESLGLAMPDDMLDSIFKTPHATGPGDSKILTTTGIHTTSIGHGARLSVEKLSQSQRARINELHAELGYQSLPMLT